MEYHQSVLLREILTYLRVVKDRWYLDATLGDGGHGIEILKAGGKLVGIDVDPEALKRSRYRFQAAGVDEVRYELIAGNFKDLDKLVSNNKFWGVIFDLGVSSYQLETPQRGFSFKNDGPLDMRMDPALSVTAADLINGLNYGELIKLFKTYGEEPNSKKIASAVVSTRPISTTKQLVDIIEKAVGGKRRKIHPATLVFQALRLDVNDELEALKEVLPKALSKLTQGGRMAVISFHSLEDRIVKYSYKNWQRQNFGVTLTNKPIMASKDEVSTNIRARSAKLRVFEKIF